MVNILRVISRWINVAVISIAAFFVPKKQSTSSPKKALYTGGSLVVLTGAIGAYAAGSLRQPASAAESDQLQTNSVDVVVSTDAASNSASSEVPVQSGVSTQLRMKTTTSTNGQTSDKRTTTTQEVKGSRKIIKKESSDGQSSVYFEVDAESDARVEMSETGNTIEIRVEGGAQQ